MLFCGNGTAVAWVSHKAGALPCSCEWHQRWRCGAKTFQPPTEKKNMLDRWPLLALVILAVRMARRSEQEGSPPLVSL